MNITRDPYKSDEMVRKRVKIILTLKNEVQVFLTLPFSNPLPQKKKL